MLSLRRTPPTQWPASTILPWGWLGLFPIVYLGCYASWGLATAEISNQLPHYFADGWTFWRSEVLGPFSLTSALLVSNVLWVVWIWARFRGPDPSGGRWSSRVGTLVLLGFFLAIHGLVSEIGSSVLADRIVVLPLHPDRIESVLLVDGAREVAWSEAERDCPMWLEPRRFEEHLREKEGQEPDRRWRESWCYRWTHEGVDVEPGPEIWTETGHVPTGTGPGPRLRYYRERGTPEPAARSTLLRARDSDGST